MPPLRAETKPAGNPLLPAVAFGKQPSIHRAGKEEIVQELRTELLKCANVVVALYGGLTVAQMQALRRAAKATDTIVKVTKNRLAQRAAKGTDAEAIVPLLKGQTLLAYSKDPVSASRAAVEFAKDHEKFVILGGAVENMALDAEGVKALAGLPSLDESRSNILRLLSAPSARIVRSLREPPARLARLAQVYARRPDLAPASKKDDINSPVALGGAGTAAGPGPLIRPQALPSRIAKNLESEEVMERLEGIREASLFLLSQEEGDGMHTGKTLSPVEIFEGANVPERLFDQLFSTNEDEARLAAYALVSGSPSFRGKLNPKTSPTDLTAVEQSEFASGFRRLLAAAGQPYFPTVEIKPTASSKEEGIRLHVIVKLSRVAPFRIGGHPVLLDEHPIVDKRMRIGSPLAEAVGGTDTLLAKDGGDGLVAVGETDMTVRPERIAGLKFPVVVHFNQGVDTVDLDLVKCLGQPVPASLGGGAATTPKPTSDGS